MTIDSSWTGSAIVHDTIAFEDLSGISILSASGGTSRLIHRSRNVRYAGSPEWSPDGMLIAFIEEYSVGKVAGTQVFEIDRHVSSAVRIVHVDGIGTVLRIET